MSSSPVYLQQSRSAATLIQGTGEMADLVRTRDWSATPLGPIEAWSETLISTVNLLLVSPFSFAVFWGKERTLIYNDTYKAFLSQKHPAALGSLGKNVWPEAWPVIGAPIDGALSDGLVTNSHDVFIPVLIDGALQDRFWTYCFYPVYENGRTAGVANIGHDSTPAVFARRKLVESEERTRMALAASNAVGIWDWHVATDRVFVDENFARIYGVDPTHIHDGLRISEFTRNVHPDDLEPLEHAIRQGLLTGQRFTAEYRLLQADGSTRWVSAMGTCTFTSDGAPERFRGVTTDISDRKQSETALLQAEKLAAVGRLAASIAHEINNPLESVMNLLYLARITPDAALIQEYIETAERELLRVSVISNQTLRFHKQSTSPRPTFCQDLFETVLSVYQGRLLNSNVLVEKRKRASKPVTCFEGEIRQVLSNLVGNAIDAMHPRGGRLLLRSREATHWTSGRRGIVLTVADTGSGISPRILHKVFDAFFTTKGIGGTGLGLWISQEIIHRHAGSLRIRSSQHPTRSGTVFALFLPFQAATPGLPLPDPVA